MSISLRPIRKTTEDSTQFGRYCSGLVRKISTIATTTAVVICATWVWLFASSTISVLVGLPFTTNVPLKPAVEVREAETDQIGVLLEPLAVLHRVGARGRGALGEDHDEHREGRRQQQHGVVPGDVLRQADVRQPARNGPEDRDVVRCEVEDPAERDHPDHGDEAAGNRLEPAPEDDQDREHRSRHEGGLPGRVADVPERLEEVDQVVAEEGQRAGLLRDAEHAADLSDRDLHADAGEEPDQHRAREEVGEEAEARDPREQEEDAGEQGREAGQPDPLRRGRLRARRCRAR